MRQRSDATPAAKAYENREARDAKLDAFYLDDERWRETGPVAYIAGHLGEITESFLAAWSEGRRHPSDSLGSFCASWLTRTYGYSEPVTLGMVLREAKLYVTNDRGFPQRRGRPAGPFVSAHEAKRWHDAVARAGRRREREGHEQYCARICAQAGVAVGPGPRDMPDSGLSDDELDAERARLARGLSGSVEDGGQE